MAKLWRSRDTYARYSSGPASCEKPDSWMYPTGPDPDPDDDDDDDDACGGNGVACGVSFPPVMSEAAAVKVVGVAEEEEEGDDEAGGGRGC